MKEKIEELLKDLGEEAVRDESRILNTDNPSIVSNGIRVLSCSNLEEAESLFDHFSDRISKEPTLRELCHILLSAKELGYNSTDMERYIDQLEKKRCKERWSSKIYLNSLALKSLGRYGITYSEMKNYLLENRYPNGSWYEKVWVTSYALEGLFYSYVDPSELSSSVDYLKSAMKDDHWEPKGGRKMSAEWVTSRALQALLLVGEGYTEEPVSSGIEWTMERIEQTDDIIKILTLSQPLCYVVKGRAQKETNYKRSQPVEFRETQVEIGEQIVGDKVQGDKVEGDKVDEKTGTKVKDSVAVRSEIGGEGSSDVEDSVALKSKIGEEGGADVSDSIVRRSNVVESEKDKICCEYSIFTGKKVDGRVKYCPKCGKKVKSEWKCCVECGFEMEKLRRLFG